MITRIREVRRARGMTLDDVARRCDPPTTPQTIGRLETGTRTVSVGWLNRIAHALGVEAQDLVEGGAGAQLKVAAILGPGGAMAPRKTAIVIPPHAEQGQVAIIPRPAGRFMFGRLINRDDEKLQILPLEAGGRQQVVANPSWLAVVRRLVRTF
jgi:transcriptional regulator with XRE-family HTH domain